MPSADSFAPQSSDSFSDEICHLQKQSMLRSVHDGQKPLCPLSFPPKHRVEKSFPFLESPNPTSRWSETRSPKPLQATQYLRCFRSQKLHLRENFRFLRQRQPLDVNSKPFSPNRPPNPQPTSRNSTRGPVLPFRSEAEDTRQLHNLQTQTHSKRIPIPARPRASRAHGPTREEYCTGCSWAASHTAKSFVPLSKVQSREEEAQTAGGGSSHCSTAASPSPQDRRRSESAQPSPQSPANAGRLERNRRADCSAEGGTAGVQTSPLVRGRKHGAKKEKKRREALSPHAVCTPPSSAAHGVL